MDFDFDPRGLVRGGRLGPQVLGHQGHRLVVDRSDIPTELDSSSGLYVCPLDRIFVRPENPVIVFGTPNVSLIVPNEHRTGWNRFAAFMAWRQPSYVADSKGRVQAGVLFELVGAPSQAVEALNEAVQSLIGTRKASCAHSVALALHKAGFTSGGKSLRWVYRPSRLASVLWRGGLEYRGQPVRVRTIQTREAVSDHFVSVWWRERSSAQRLVRKQYSGDQPHRRAPVFEPAIESIPMPDQLWADGGVTTDLGISIPSRTGANLGFVFGEQPEFVIRLPQSLNQLGLRPLRSFPGELDWVTKVKKYILFSRPVIWFIRRHLVARREWVRNVPLRALPFMMRQSHGAGRDKAFAYNLVVTNTEIRLKRLQNDNGRDQKLVNWMLAKHVLLSGYSREVILAGEAWCYRDARDNLILCVSPESGTYKPDEARFELAIELLSRLFEVEMKLVRR